MIARNFNPPILYLSTPSPENSPSTSTIFSDCEADDEHSMSEELTPSRPLSYAQGSLNPQGPYCPRIPTLQEVLANSAAPPYTLSAFTAHLSHNHCLENLEFIKDVERYGKKYDIMAAEMAGMPITPLYKGCDEVRMLWQRLLHAYIIPDAPREVNLSADVRDALIALPNHTAPPAPDSLEPAVERILELMNESIMMTFINEYTPSRASPSLKDDLEDFEERQTRGSTEEARQRSRSRRKPSPHGDSITSGLHHTFSSHTSNSHPSSSHTSGAHASGSHGSISRHSQAFANIGKARLHMHAGNSSAGSADSPLTDDSGSLLSPSDSPMTPPTTPPSSDLGGTSPRARNDNTWRKMMVRLGTKKSKSSSSGKMDRMEE